MEDLARMRLGFLGSGSITSAIVTGLRADGGLPCPILLSPRNAHVAARLAGSLREVSVAETNQAVLDECDIVFLAVRPQVTREVLASVKFRPVHRVISLVATFSHGSIAALVRPAASVTCAVPLPTVAFHRGPTAIFPPDSLAAALFGRLGVAVEAATESELQALWASTAMMAPYFTYLGSLSAWLTDQGVPQSRAHDYIDMMFSGLGFFRQGTGTTFAELAEAFKTKGGLNEQCAAQLEQAGVFDACTRALDGILTRIRSSALLVDAPGPGRARSRS